MGVELCFGTLTGLPSQPILLLLLGHFVDDFKSTEGDFPVAHSEHFALADFLAA